MNNLIRQLDQLEVDQSGSEILSECKNNVATAQNFGCSRKANMTLPWKPSILAIASGKFSSHDNLPRQSASSPQFGRPWCQCPEIALRILPVAQMVIP